MIWAIDLCVGKLSKKGLSFFGSADRILQISFRFRYNMLQINKLQNHQKSKSLAKQHFGLSTQRKILFNNLTNS